MLGLSLSINGPKMLQDPTRAKFVLRSPQTRLIIRMY
jgi:hypothetical protein